ncbi:hypothetical protein O1L44_00455 [Streptomyces noursei]|uniref:hypothetical protein n=1 Tax=Streptomyces noursei TaxID=1971 RepID=UPI00081D1C4A|nr:hypothetical protein SNOUR_05635 [Streptomyces noursei ATCC 11455]MCZ0991914.1 hypothetical protein [Streptomyces noursei]
MTETPAPDALLGTPPLAGPTCGACGARAAVQWQRRLTDTEFAAHLALEEARRDERLRLADSQQPAPGLGPMPTPGECVTPVFGCAAHAITADAAALVHQKTCAAPDPAHLPGCNCTPELASQSGSQAA